MNEGRQITKEQAEACMKDDWQFEVRSHANGTHSFNGRNVLFKLDDPNDYFEPSDLSLEELLERSPITIHADPNNTFGRLFGDDRELTFEEAWAALGRGETVLGRQGDAIQDDYFLFKFEHKDGGGPRIVYGNANKFGEKQTKDWSGRFGGFDLVTFVKPDQLEPSPQPEPLTLEALDARLKALEATS